MLQPDVRFLPGFGRKLGRGSSSGRDKVSGKRCFRSDRFRYGWGQQIFWTSKVKVSPRFGLLFTPSSLGKKSVINIEVRSCVGIRWEKMKWILYEARMDFLLKDLLLKRSTFQKFIEKIISGWENKFCLHRITYSKYSEKLQHFDNSNCWFCSIKQGRNKFSFLETSTRSRRFLITSILMNKEYERRRRWRTDYLENNWWINIWLNDSWSR